MKGRNMIMGCFDYVKGKIKCPNCKTIFEAEDQVKWTNCMLQEYEVGDKIPAKDGEYTYGSSERGKLISFCPMCDSLISFKVVVKNGKVYKVKETGLIL
jgi:hypothetical protein